MDFDPIQTSFIQAMRGIAATVSVISSRDNLDKQAMTATSVASLSLEPPSMLVCVNVDFARFTRVGTVASQVIVFPQSQQRQTDNTLKSSQDKTGEGT